MRNLEICRDVFVTLIMGVGAHLAIGEEGPGKTEIPTFLELIF